MTPPNPKQPKMTDSSYQIPSDQPAVPAKAEKATSLDTSSSSRIESSARVVVVRTTGPVNLRVPYDPARESERLANLKANRDLTTDSSS